MAAATHEPIILNPVHPESWITAVQDSLCRTDALLKTINFRPEHGVFRDEVVKNCRNFRTKVGTKKPRRGERYDPGARAPGSRPTKESKPRRGDRLYWQALMAFDFLFCRPSGACPGFDCSLPGADAPGYSLSPLRGSAFRDAVLDKSDSGCRMQGAGCTES